MLASQTLSTPAGVRRSLEGSQPRWVSAATCILALLALGACAGTVFQAGPGGVPPRVTEGVSLVVGQTRAQFPERSGTAIPFEMRSHGDEALPTAEPALKGQGVSMTPGLQKEQPRRITVELHLDKPGYSSGFLKVQPQKGAGEVWPVVAFDKKGEPTGQFDFIYVLAAPDGRLHYLALIGGRFEQDEQEFAGFEGTLILPGQGNDLENWRRAYKIDFGYRFPLPPVHEGKVDEAVGLFNALQRDVKEVQRLQASIAAAEGRVATLQVRPSDQETAEQREKALQDSQAQAAKLEESQTALIVATEGRFLRYYELRAAIALEYALFVESNLYRWQSRAGKQAYYERWRVVEFHHPRIDEAVAQFILHLEDKGKLKRARADALNTITSQNNWAKNPERQQPAQ